jgi:ABC-type polysaccharide/polyol phosphate export permease
LWRRICLSYNLQWLMIQFFSLFFHLISFFAWVTLSKLYLSPCVHLTLCYTFICQYRTTFNVFPSSLIFPYGFLMSQFSWLLYYMPITHLIVCPHLPTQCAILCTCIKTFTLTFYTRLVHSSRMENSNYKWTTYWT